jgi:hypothetical protein
MPVVHTISSPHVRFKAFKGTYRVDKLETISNRNVRFKLLLPQSFVNKDSLVGHRKIPHVTSTTDLKIQSKSLTSIADGEQIHPLHPYRAKGTVATISRTILNNALPNYGMQDNLVQLYSVHSDLHFNCRSPTPSLEPFESSNTTYEAHGVEASDRLARILWDGTVGPRGVMTATTDEGSLNKMQDSTPVAQRLMTGPGPLVVTRSMFHKIDSWTFQTNSCSTKLACSQSLISIFPDRDFGWILFQHTYIDFDLNIYNFYFQV